MAPKSKVVKSKYPASNKTINAFFKACIPPVDPPQVEKMTVIVELHADHSVADGKLGNRAVTTSDVNITSMSPIVTVAAASRASIAKGWSDEITAYSDSSDAEYTAPASEHTTLSIAKGWSDEIAPDSSDAECTATTSDDTVTVSPPVAVSETPPTVPDKKRKRTEHKLFPQKWLKQYSWMRHNHANNSMFCQLCTDQGKHGVWVDGTRNFRLKTITDHLVSKDHLHCLSASHSGQHRVPGIQSEHTKKREAAILLALQTCYFLSLEEIPNVKFKAFLGFLRFQEVESALYLVRGRNARYDSSDIFNQLLSCLSRCVEKIVLKEVRTSPFVGIGLDESTDRSSEKHLAVVLRYIAPSSDVTTCFLHCVKVRDGKAVTIHQAVHDTCRKHSIPMTKIVGLGTDGASVMASDLNGVNGLMTHDNPHIIFCSLCVSPTKLKCCASMCQGARYGGAAGHP